ncbi:hypothetical protein D3C71_1984570 [compost metagenome]
MPHLGVADTTQAAADAEDAHLDAQTRQRLAQFQPDYARPEHRHAAGQIVPGENVVVHHQAIAQRTKRRRHRGP